MTNDLTSALQKGLFEEEANHNLEAAAQAYRDVSAQFDKDRKVAATAVFRLGEIYRKQGKTNEAVVQYERIIREFSDQETLATLSRQNLVSLGEKRGTAISSPVTQAARLSQKELLNEEIKLLELDLAELRKQFAAGIVSQTEVRAKEREVLKLRQQAAALEVGAEDVAIDTTVTDEEEKEIRRIHAMIKNSPDLINSAGEGEVTPLARAASAGWLRVAKFLLENGALVDRISGNSTPLHHATSTGHKAMVELLLERGADVNARDGTGGTALHLAAKKGFLSVAEVLIKHKADLNARNSESNGEQTPLQTAVKTGHPAMVEFLVSKDANLEAQDRNGMTALSLAAFFKQNEIVTKLLALRANPNVQGIDGRTALSWAASLGSLEIVRTLLASKADPNAGTNDLPLLWAAYSKSLEMAELLIRAGADPKKVSKFSKEVQPPGSTRSSFGGFGDFFGPYLPLQIAVRQQDAPMVKLLLKFKADPNAKNPAGEPLVLDTIGNAEMLKALLSAGADPNVKGRNAQTALHLAAASGQMESAEVLLAHEADVNARDVIGNTPLYWAVDSSSKPIVVLLLAKGADPNTANNSGQTPLDRTKSGRTLSEVQIKEIAPLLRQHGALDDLPKLDRIEVRRADYSAVLFRKGTNDWNQFTMLELIGVEYGILATQNRVQRYGSTVDPWKVKNERGRANPLPFPDFARVIVHRLSPDGKTRKSQPVDVSVILNTGDCAKDVALNWGDVVEIPEQDHPITEVWSGFSIAELNTLQKCLARKLTIAVKDQTIPMSLQPSIHVNEGKLTGLVNNRPFMLWPVLEESQVLRSSSDLTRVKVTRSNTTGKKQEWVFDCSDPSKAPDLWLREGDVIEVPDKP